MVVSPPDTSPWMPTFFEGLANQLAPNGILILDLTQAAMNSEVIGRIVLFNKSAKSKKSTLKLVMPDDHPSRGIFRITRLDKVFTIYPTIDAALAALS